MSWRADLETLLTNIDHNLAHAHANTNKTHLRSSASAARHTTRTTHHHLQKSPTQHQDQQQPQDDTIESAEKHTSLAPSPPRAPPPLDDDAVRALRKKLLDSVNFELESRGAALQTQLDGVREELARSLELAERKALELAKDHDATLEASLAAERECRKASEASVARVESAVVRTRGEVFDAISELQGTCLDHSELLRRLEQDLVAFKVDVESRLADVSRRVESLGEKLRGAEALHGVATAEETIARLKETEMALLKEREMRKVLEKDMEAMRSDVEAIAADLEASVARDLEREAATGSGSTLEDKVKECGRLILRMGGDLMEEGKRRQALEAEVHELRMRTTTVESLARAAPVVGPAPDAVFAEQALAAAMHAEAATAAASHGCCAGAVGGSPSLETPYGGAPPSCHATGGAMAPPPLPSAAEAAPGSCSRHIAPTSATWGAKTEGAVDAALAGLRPRGGGGSLSASASYSQLRPQFGSSLATSASHSMLRPSLSTSQLRTPAVGGGSAAPDTGGRPSGAIGSAARMTREQLDERVRQILGKHATARPGP